MPHWIIKKWNKVSGKCMSAEKHFDLCHECARVQTCKEPIAKDGRIRLAKRKVDRLRKELDQAKKDMYAIIYSP